jgi:hypothetical protein
MEVSDIPQSYVRIKYAIIATVDATCIEHEKYRKLLGLSRRANYTDRGTTAFW